MPTMSLEQVLAEEQLRPTFQPIVDARAADIYGYEALIRGPSGTSLASPAVLFERAIAESRLLELDLLARRLCIQQFARLELPGFLFVNVMPQALLEPSHREGLTLQFLQREGVSPERVIIELTEQHAIDNYAVFRDAIDHYRGMGFRVALDDLGAAYSGLRHWSEFQPDFIKIDRPLIEGLDQCREKRRFIDWLQEAALDMGCEVIAEGVETLGEYQCLWSRQWRFLQGYHFARPEAEPPRRLLNLMGSNAKRGSRYSGTVSSVCRPVAAFDAYTPITEVARHLTSDGSRVQAIPVTENGRPYGIIRHEALVSYFANPYAYALYASRPAKAFVDREASPISADTALEVLSERITESPGTPEEDVIVTDAQGYYMGMASIIDLLRRITQLQLRNARHAHPLTNMPGNLPIHDELTRRLEQSEAFIAVYCDLDHFKAFNDRYGYAAGDDLILALARLLQCHFNGRQDFIGHVGGDDFLLLLPPGEWRSRCEALLQAFDEEAPRHYDPDDREAGGMWVPDRQHIPRFFPVCSLSLAALPIQQGADHHPRHVSDRLSALKSQAKAMPGSSLFSERRDPIPEKATSSERQWDRA